MFQLVLADDTSEQNHVRLALSTGGHDDSVSFVDNHELALDSFQGLPFGSELLGGFFSRLIQNGANSRVQELVKQIPQVPGFDSDPRVHEVQDRPWLTMVRRSHFQREAYALEQALLKEIYALLSEGSLEDSACIQELVSKLPGLHIPLFAGEETLCETRMFPIFFHLLASGNVSGAGKLVEAGGGTVYEFASAKSFYGIGGHFGMRESANCLLSLVFSQAPQSSDGLAFLVSELPPGVLSQTITFEDTDPSFNATGSYTCPHTHNAYSYFLASLQRILGQGPQASGRLSLDEQLLSDLQGIHLAQRKLEILQYAGDDKDAAFTVHNYGLFSQKNLSRMNDRGYFGSLSMKLVAMSVGELLEQIAWTIDFFTDLAVYRSIYASFWERSGREPSGGSLCDVINNKELWRIVSDDDIRAFCVSSFENVSDGLPREVFEQVRNEILAHPTHKDGLLALESSE